MAITQNRKASHNYTLEDTFEVGMVLTGWEVKAIRAGRAQIKEGYVLIQNAELFLVGAHISPLPEASTHVRPDPVRKRKLLMHAKEIRKLLGKTERAGYTLVPLDLHYSRGYVKLKIALAKGKRQYDKRRSEQERDWQRTQQRVLRGKGTKGADAYE